MRALPQELLECEIVADAGTAAPLGAIARTCALDVGQSLTVRVKQISRGEPSITFRASPAAIIEHDLAWSLAVRVACFCPQARVAVLIEAPTTSGFGNRGSAARANAA